MWKERGGKWFHSLCSPFEIIEHKHKNTMIEGFRNIYSYDTICVGSVHWFNNKINTFPKHWQEMFDEYYYRPEFRHNNDDSLDKQIDFMDTLDLSNRNNPLLYFMNICPSGTP